LNNRIKFQIGDILLGIERPKVMVDNKGFHLNSNASKKGCNMRFITLAVAVNEERRINAEFATWLSHLYFFAHRAILAIRDDQLAPL
jgi:hypothetical protein